MVTKGEGDKRGTHSTRKLDRWSGKAKRFDLNMLLRYTTRSSWHQTLSPKLRIQRKVAESTQYEHSLNDAPAS